MPLLVFALIYPTRGVATALSFIVGIGDATSQSGIFPLAGSIHPRCTAAASLGSAVAGLVAGLLRLLTKAVFPETSEGERLSSSVYFGIAVIILAFCTMSHYAIKKYKQEFMLAFFEGEIGAMTAEEEENDEEGCEGEVAEAEDSRPDDKDESFEDNEQTNVQENEPASQNGKMCRPFSVCIEGSLVYREAFRCAWLPIIAQFINFIITLSLFPGVSK